MSQRLFDSEKVGIFLDGFGPRIEKRKGDEVKLLDLTLRVQPLTPALATTLAGDGLIKKSLFKMTDSTPLPNLKSVSFDVHVPRQVLQIFAAPDTEVASIALDQVEISDLRARTEKGVDGWGLVFYASFGPVSKQELEFVQRWYTAQQFVTFSLADPTLDFESDEAPVQNAEELGTDPPSAATDEAQRSVGARQNLHSHAARRARTH